MFSLNVDCPVEKVFMPLLYPMVMLMSLAVRTGILWPLDPMDMGPVVEQPRVVLVGTCLTFSVVAVLHAYTACFHLGVFGPVRLRPQFAWVAPVALWFVSVAFFNHYVDFPGITGTHPAEQAVANVTSCTLFIFTLALVGVSVSLCSSNRLIDSVPYDD
ncbi:unnamed protein product [Urochloa decumbens]|uniref:Transmembrane protein n=1 Tax=Urochloa decumbens TaxID=240449 RepID=A0ABC9GRN1_9POAL